MCLPSLRPRPSCLRQRRPPAVGAGGRLEGKLDADGRRPPPPSRRRAPSQPCPHPCRRPLLPGAGFGAALRGRAGLAGDDRRLPAHGRPVPDRPRGHPRPSGGPGERQGALRAAVQRGAGAAGDAGHAGKPGRRLAATGRRRAGGGPTWAFAACGAEGRAGHPLGVVGLMASPKNLPSHLISACAPPAPQGLATAVWMCARFHYLPPAEERAAWERALWERRFDVTLIEVSNIIFRWVGGRAGGRVGGTAGAPRGQHCWSRAWRGAAAGPAGEASVPRGRQRGPLRHMRLARRCASPSPAQSRKLAGAGALLLAGPPGVGHTPTATIGGPPLPPPRRRAAAWASCTGCLPRCLP